MAALSHSESRRLYSWWWDSHNSPKNSKWLQDNLTDIDSKVKSMIKLLEEDADSFARRAEMYYKKRPELMKLVEEFYRAYRALAERYNHATGELRHAHRTLAKAFPDQVPLELIEDSPSKPLTDKEPPTPETKTVCTLFGTDSLLDNAQGLGVSPKGGRRGIGWKQLPGMSREEETVAQNSKSVEPGIGKGLKLEKENDKPFHDEVLRLSNENQHLKEEVPKETERAGKAVSEVDCLKRALFDILAEKEGVLLEYQRCLEELSSVEGELNNAKNGSIQLNERASRAEIEVQTLNEALVELQAEKNAGGVKHKEYLEKISNLERVLFQIQKHNQGLDASATEAEIEAQNLKDDISRLEREREAVFQQYNQCLEKISVLENLISILESEARLLKKQAETAENEVSELKQSLADLNKEKEASALRYKCCSETISKLERDISSAKEEVKRLNNDVLIGNQKLKTAEEKCALLEMSNLSLKSEAENLAKKISLKDQLLSQKQQELENLQTCLQDEQSHHAQVEATLQSLHDVHSQSQDDQRALTLELENVLHMLKDLEASKLNLQEEIHLVQEEKQSFASLMENVRNEVITLKEINERLEKEVSHHNDLSDSLQQEIMRLKEEIEGLNRNYQALVEQVEAAGLNPKCVGSSVKSLQDENRKLKEKNEEGSNEREILSKKLKDMQLLLDKKVALESSLSHLSIDLESSHEKGQALQESCQFLHGDKDALVSEKASLLYQLQVVTYNMQKLLEKNAVLENNLSTAKVELEGLREKTKGLENICELLKEERSYLLNERSSLAFRLENVERKLENLEKRYTGLEEKYVDLEKEKEAVNSQVEELKSSLFMEKQERNSSQLQSDTRLAGLENQIHFLKEENGWKKKEYEEELEKSLKAQFEMSILHKFIKDMEEKNCSLIIECQKHVEASKLAEKLISELESESLEQQVEAEILLDEIERLRLSIYQVFRSLETGTDSHPDDKIENAQTFVHHIVGAIEDMKCSIAKQEDDMELLVVENSVLLTLLEQLESKGMEIELQKIQLEQELNIMADGLAMAINEKDNLLEVNSKLKSGVSESRQRTAILEPELEILCNKQSNLHKSYNALEETYMQVNKDNSELLKKLSDLKEEKYRVDQHSNAALLECLAMANQSVILKNFGEEKALEVQLLLNDLKKQHEINCSLEKEMCSLAEKLELQKAENFILKDDVHKLEGEMQGMREYNIQMKKEIICGKESLLQTEEKLLDSKMKLQTAEYVNLKLCRTADALKTDIQESIQIKENLEKDIIRLSEVNSIQEEEMEFLNVFNTSFEVELSQLREEMEEKIVREQSLCSKLQEKNNEFELWEAEASAFYFDFQISSVHEVLFKNKVQELTGVCRTLESEKTLKTSEIELMKGKICSMENEINGLKSQLSAYNPVIDALREDIMLLEHSALLLTKAKAFRNQESETLEVAADPNTSNSVILLEDQSLVSFQSLHMRVKAVGKLMEEINKSASRRRSKSKSSKQASAMDGMEQVKSRRCLSRDKHEHSQKKGQGNETSNTPKLQKIKTKPSEPRNGTLIKDIPLDQLTTGSLKGIRKKRSGGTDDQILELWENAEDRRDLTTGELLRKSYKMTEKDIVYDDFGNVRHSSEPPSTDSDVEKELGMDRWDIVKISGELKREVSGRRVLKRLASDAQKLENLQATVENLRSKLETNGKGRKAKNMDFETVQEQLLEAEETVLHLVDLNGRLVKNIEECPSPDEKASPQKKEAVKTRRRKVTEQAREGSERIGRLQLELQKIQYILFKLEEEKKDRAGNKFFKNKTIILRDFIYNGKKNSGRRKMGPLCGCFRPSTSRNGSSPSF